MRGWLTRALLALLAIGACWGGAIWYWRAGNRSPDATDMIVWLLVLPLAVMTVLWLGRVLFKALFAAPAVAVALPAPAAPAEAPPAPPPPALTVVATALRSPHGATPAALAATLKDQKAHPALDPELLDDSGYPQMSARAAMADASADGEALREQVAIWMALNGHAGIAFDDEQWRTLALAHAVAVELGERAGLHAQLAATPAPAASVPLLQLLPLWPANWQPAQVGAANAWLQHGAAQGGWPLERIVTPAPQPTHVAPAPTAVLARLAQHVAEARTPLVAIVLSAASHIGTASVGQWSDKGSIFSARHPQGLIPGEGAAGLLLADAAQAMLLAGEGPPEGQTLLHSLDAMRDASADSARRHDPAMLQYLTSQVLGYGATEAAKVGMLVADTGHRNSRTLELMALAGVALPHLDAGDDVLRAGAACGSCGDVPFMTALALAAHHATELDAAVLCIGNEDPFRRSAALIRPAAAA